MNQTNIVNRQLTASNSILKGLRWDSTIRSSASSSFSSSSSLHHRAFTLIELLVVIAVMAILAALVIPVTGAVKAASTKSRVRAELAQFETAIDRYKIKLGHYPPDNPPANPNDPWPLVNQLYYE